MNLSKEELIAAAAQLGPAERRLLTDFAFDPLVDAETGERIELALPIGWRMTQRRRDGAAYYNGAGLQVIISGIEIEGKRWVHVSLSRRRRLPSWDDVKVVKNLFIGPELLAIQVLPPKRQWVNIHPFCLHLWHCMDGDPVPDFRLGTGMI